MEADLLVIGGGINGAGIARDAAGRGLKVVLCEKDDLASATSSASSKLIHGGLRYLEYYEFRLVREALLEREMVLGIAPHISWPMRFVLPQDASLRATWIIRAGLFLYDHLGRRRRLPKSHGLDLKRDPAGAPLRPEFVRGFDYSDGWVDDARLVVLNAMDAAARGATILTRHECVSARADRGRWRAALDAPDGRSLDVSARIIVNAAGPWVGRVLGQVLGHTGEGRLRLVKGSHIVVPALYDGPQAYILQNPDRRIVFAIPYEGRFTLVGTTDVPYEGDPSAVQIDPAETDYLCTSVNRYFRNTIRPQDVVWSYSGVRPLYDNNSAAHASAVTRDYVFDVTGGTEGRPVLLSIYGGKITTYRRLAEHAMEKLAPHLGQSAASPWTGHEPLPGGDMPDADFESFLAGLRRAYPWLPHDLATRYARAYGTRCAMVLSHKTTMADLGVHFGGGLYEAEVEYLCEQEWAETAGDILWRRSKLGLHLGEDGATALGAWLARRTAAQAESAAAPSLIREARGR